MNGIASSPIPFTKELASQRWRILALPSALVFVAFALAMYDTLSSLLDLWWHSEGYGHGFVVLAGSVYLLYLRREEIAAVRPRPSVLGLLLTGALVGVWFVSRILSVLVGEQVALVLTLLALILALYGVQTAKMVALPILYLFCAIPIWSYLIPALRDSTAQASTALSRAMGVPIYLEGVYMSIPDGVFLVAEVCAGISYLLAAMSLGVFYALLNLYRAWTRIVLVAVAVAAGVIFNWVRVTSIVLIGHHSQMQHPLVQDHILFGWVLFVLVIIFVMVCGRFLERFDARAGARVGSAAHDGGEPRANSRAIWTVAVVCVAAFSIPAYSASRLAAPARQTVVVSLPEHLGRESGWRSDVTAPGDSWSASIQAATSTARASYNMGQQRVDVQLGYFAIQRQGSEAVNNRHALFDAESWRRVSQKVMAKQVAIAPGLAVNEVSIRHLQRADRRLVWWLYWVDQTFTADPVQAKILQLRSIFSGNRQAAIIVVSSAVSGKVEKTRDGMKDWLRESADPLAAKLREISRSTDL